MTDVLRVCGLDEAGRGALAGPIVIAAVVFPYNFKFENVAPGVIVRDSKKLSIKQRETVFKIIEKHSLEMDFEVIMVREINEKGINWANMEGFRRLIKRLDADEYIIDGRWKIADLGDKAPLTGCMIDADEYIPSALAAGIVAKIKRDLIMQELHLQYPQYGWDTNTGHGTQKHIGALLNYGLCEYHRIQFVKTALGEK